MWPDQLPRLNRVKATATNLSPARKVPEKKSDFNKWALPVKNPDPLDSTRGWIMAILSLSNRKTRCELTVVLKGFAQQRQLALELTGNWNKK